MCLAGKGSSPSIADRMLDMLTGLGIGQVANREILARLLERIVGAEVGPGVVDEWHETAWEYGYRYFSDPREVLVADLAINLARLELLLAHQSDSTAGRWLNDVGARLATMLAMACVDMGYVAEARWAWRLTRRRSDAGAQPETQLWVRGQEAILGLLHGAASSGRACPRRTWPCDLDRQAFSGRRSPSGREGTDPVPTGPRQGSTRHSGHPAVVFRTATGHRNWLHRLDLRLA